MTKNKPKHRRHRHHPVIIFITIMQVGRLYGIRRIFHWESKYNYRVRGCRLQMQPVWFPETPRLDGCYIHAISYYCMYFHTKVVWRGFRYVWSWRRYYYYFSAVCFVPLSSSSSSSCCCGSTRRSSSIKTDFMLILQPVSFYVLQLKKR